jgi:hypothetical protein
MEIDLTNLTDAVTRTEGVAASAKLLILEFAKEVARLGALPTVDPADLTALADRMNASADDLAAAVAANPDPNPND